MRLADLTDLKAGRAPSMARGEIPQVARALPIAEGDLIVAARGNGTDICSASELAFGAYISLDLYLVRPNPRQVVSEYLRAVLELPATQALLASEKQGSGLARLPKDALEKIAIPLPPLPQQHLVAALALSLAHEQILLRKLTEQKERLGGEVLSRAIQNIEDSNSRRSA